MLWIAWCGLMFFVALVGGSALWQRAVVVPDCARSCETTGASFDHLRIGGRTGPSTACICADERAIDTNLPDFGILVSAVVFLVACWIPFVLLARRPSKTDPPTR